MGVGHEGEGVGWFYRAVLGVPVLSHSQNKAWSRHGALCIPWDPPGTLGMVLGGCAAPEAGRVRMGMGPAPPLDEILCGSRAMDQHIPGLGKCRCCQERVWIPGALMSFVGGPEHTGGSGRQENPWGPPVTPDASVLACWDFQ